MLLGVLLFVAVVAFTVWQICGLVKDCKTRKSVKNKVTSVSKK